MTEKLKSWGVTPRVLLVGAVGGIMISLAALAIQSWIDENRRREHYRQMREMEAHALGNERPSPDNFFPLEVVPRMPVLTGYNIMAASQAGDAVEDDEVVLAVTIEGESRAYPINVMTGPEREIFNDKLGGRLIAATW